MVEWSLGYPLSEFCPTAPAASQVVRITKNRKFDKKSHTNDLLWNLLVKWAQTMVKWSLGYPLSEFCLMAPATSQVVRNTKNSKFGKKSFKNYLLWNCWVKWAQTMVKWSLDGPLSELYPTIPPKKMADIAKNRWFTKIRLQIFPSEIAGSMGPKLLWNGH